MTSAKHLVLSVDDQPLFCEGLRSRLEREPDLAWAGRATCESVVADTHRCGAGVVIVEITTDGGDPFEVIRDVTSVCPHTRVMVLSADVRDHAIDEALEAGASAYFSKRDSADAVIEGIRTILKGRRAFGPSVRDRCIDTPKARDGAASGTLTHNGHSSNGKGSRSEGTHLARFNLLTPREREVLRMIGQGMTRRAIAEAMHRSPKTVDCHRASVMEKLAINDRVELARYAIREGIAQA